MGTYVAFRRLRADCLASSARRHRGGELDGILRSLDLDDAVVDNAGDRDSLVVAAEVLERAAW
jgi:hypothetical protein